jgi:glycosyltransferase involved in cell wall biosynthesis
MTETVKSPEVRRAGGERALLAIASMGGGGAERHVAYLARGLAARGWEVTVALLDPGPNLERLAGTSVRVELIPRRSNHDPRIVTRLAALAARMRPRVCHGWMQLMNTAGAAAARLAGVPFVGGEQACAEAYADGWKARLEARLLARCAAAVVANSHGGRRYVEARVGGRVPVHVIANAVPVGEIDAAPLPPPGALEVPESAPVVVFAGRFDAQKNLPALFHALARALEARPDAVAVLCGDGPERARWEAWVRARGLAGRVRFPGYVKEVWPWMKRADAFFFPSLFEGQPNAVMEAMACRAPLVVSDIPAHREFLCGEVAELAPPDAPEALAAALLRTLGDPVSAAARAERARCRVERYTVDAMVDAHERLYRAITAARVPAAPRPAAGLPAAHGYHRRAGSFGD